MLRTLAVTLAATACVVAQTNFPPPQAPANNPHTPEKELLGMALFFEEQLSSNNQVACATCHELGAGGVDPRAFDAFNPGADGIRETADDQFGSPGLPFLTPTGGTSPAVMPNVFGEFTQTTNRRSPTVINSGYHTSYGYDGRHDTLESLIAEPLLNTTEMAHLGRDWADVTSKLASSEPMRLATQLPPRLATFVANQSYGDLFQQAFGSSAITETRVVQALATYLRTLNSDESPWDGHLNGTYTLTAEENLGLQLFTSTANGATACNTCHGDFNNRVLTEGPIVGQMTSVPAGYYGSPIPVRLLFHNIGIRPPSEDPGRGSVTGVAADQGLFRVQPLRNIEISGPFFHNGSAATLEEAIDLYDRGGDFHQNQAPSLTPRNYTQAEKDALVAILKTLTDPRLATGAYPFDRPLLSTQVSGPIGPSSETAHGKLIASAPFAAMVAESEFQMALSGASIGSFTFLMWDTQAAAAPGPLNEQLALSSSFAIYAIGPAQWSPLVANGQAGISQINVPIPANPQLAGMELFSQWAVLEPSATNPIALSNGLKTRIY
ncbi:MAG: cytochrome-c peroxidase [Planctomycetota bacterium]